MAACLAVLLSACQQAASPGAAGQQLAGAGNGAGSGGAGGGLVRVLVSGGQGLQARFPGLARVQLTIADRANPHQVAIQLNLPTNGTPLPLNLPGGQPLDFTYDLFDAAGNYLAHGMAAASVTSGTSVVPVQINAVPAGTPYVDPLTGVVVNGPVAGLTVSVFSGASMRPAAGAVVLLGNGQQGVTDAAGIVNFISAPARGDVHVFAGGDAVSVLGFAGGALTVPMPEETPVSGRVTVSPAPTLAAGELMDVYLTDGMRVQPIGHAAGDASPVFASPGLQPMRGPIGITGLFERLADGGLRPDRGIALASAAGHDAFAPLAGALPDPYAQPRLTTVLDGYTAAAMPPGMGPASSVTLEVFAVNGTLWQFVSHKNNGVTPQNRREITIWPVPAAQYVWRASVTDGYAAVQAWRRAASLANPPAWQWPAATPAVSAASAQAVSWADTGAEVWDGFEVELRQGVHVWRVYGLAAATQVVLPAAPAGAVPPLTPGIPATAQVREYSLDPAAGFDPANPDVWNLARMLRFRAISAPFAFVP
ncbi:MAG: hypothetical protein R8K47_05020 [Mariprofundaceae bacterium]